MSNQFACVNARAVKMSGAVHDYTLQNETAGTTKTRR